MFRLCCNTVAVLGFDCLRAGHLCRNTSSVVCAVGCCWLHTLPPLLCCLVSVLLYCFPRVSPSTALHWEWAGVGVANAWRMGCARMIAWRDDRLDVRAGCCLRPAQLTRPHDLRLGPHSATEGGCGLLVELVRGWWSGQLCYRVDCCNSLGRQGDAKTALLPAPSPVCLLCTRLLYTDAAVWLPVSRPCCR